MGKRHWDLVKDRRRQERERERERERETKVGFKDGKADRLVFPGFLLDTLFLI